MVQVIIGENKGQGVKLNTIYLFDVTWNIHFHKLCRVASKQFWDEKNDSMSVHYYLNESLFCVSIAYGAYHYWKTKMKK